ncbi:YbhB/YbcL family Raf kinase inhibitor-like protein [Halovenus sp. HT40]|uniref:YbhB/YbcL family Raf kinase inhibitor-like protein n=1 Tax=Halovenus sp. HT40 TaxID=3126691 RepID=UPI00300F3B40
MAATPLNGDIEQQGELILSSPEFDDSEGMPDFVGYVNDDENPELHIESVPEEAESLVLIVDDPDAEPAAGHVWNHWAVWDIDPDIGMIPRGWDGDAIEGYNDFVEQGYSGPSPPDGAHGYRFKLLALDSELDMPPETRKSRLGSAITLNAEVLAATQIVGEYHPDQGTAF